MDNARVIARDVLLRCEEANGYSNIALDTAIRRAQLSDADRALLTVLVYGVLERKLTLDACIDGLRTKGGEALSSEVRTALRLGIYQLAYLDRVPDHAAVNESVALVTRRARGVVNAILRAFLRGGKAIPCPDRHKDPVGYLCVKYSFCREIVARFLSVFGEERTESLLSAFCREPHLTLRVNTLRITRAELLAAFAARGVRAEASRESASGIYVLDKLPVTELYGFDEGLFFVQDEASQLCVEALDARAGMRVLDTCACPGSKSFGAAIAMEDKGAVHSRDLHRSKLSLVESGAARLGIASLSVEQMDARQTTDEQYDRVLCDVPCSGFGVFAKKPELRYKDPALSAALPEIQSAILNASARAVRAGGRLVYSTCTLLPEENGEQIARFLAEHRDFTLLRERTLTPDVDGTDGFYFAVLEKSTC